MVAIKEKTSAVRIALFSAEQEWPRWQHEMVEHLLAIPQISIEQVIHWPVKVRTGRAVRRVLIQCVLNCLSLIDCQVLGWLGNARIKRDSHLLLSDSKIPLLQIKGNQSAVETAFIAAQIDLVIDLQGIAELPDFLFATRTGRVWSHCYDRHLGIRPEQFGLDAFATAENVFYSGLISRTKNGQAQRILHTTTSIDKLLFSQNIDQALAKMTDFIPSLLRRCHSAAQLLALIEQQQYQLAHYPQHQAMLPLPEAGDDTDGATMSTGQTKGVIQRFLADAQLLTRLLQILGRSAARFIKAALLKLGLRPREQWIILLGQQNASDADTTHKATKIIDVLESAGLSGLTDLKQMVPPADRFWADPFLLSQSGRDYLFFEELVYQQNKGRLMCVELDNHGINPINGIIGQPIPIMEQPYHLSYPFLFRYQGELYLMPESAAERCLTVYRCEQFPDHWVKVKTLMDDVEAYDATLYEHHGRWWLFVCLRHHHYAAPNELLYLFYADTPLSDQWQSHPCNPIVTDAATARPAGNLLAINDKLYRPSQNCAGAYGRGINLNEVLVLNEQEYQEQTVSQFIPANDSALNGVHTLNCLKDRVVSDAIVRRW